MEPNALLQRAFVRLGWFTSRVGITEQDRALLDSLRDYLQRHGCVL
jgi:hypothetical protein